MCFVLLPIILICILVPLSLSGVEYDEYGFISRRSTGKVDISKIYEAGLYGIGPDYTFLSLKKVRPTHP